MHHKIEPVNLRVSMKLFKTDMEQTSQFLHENLNDLNGMLRIDSKFICKVPKCFLASLLYSSSDFLIHIN